MSKLFYVHIRVQGRKGYRDLAYVQNFAVFFFDSLPNLILPNTSPCVTYYIIMEPVETVEEPKLKCLPVIITLNTIPIEFSH